MVYPYWHDKCHKIVRNAKLKQLDQKYLPRILLKSKPGFSIESQAGHDIGENIVETLQHHLFGCLLGPL